MDLNISVFKLQFCRQQGGRKKSLEKKPRIENFKAKDEYIEEYMEEGIYKKSSFYPFSSITRGHAETWAKSN